MGKIKNKRHGLNKEQDKLALLRSNLDLKWTNIMVYSKKNKSIGFRGERCPINIVPFALKYEPTGFVGPTADSGFQTVGAVGEKVLGMSWI